MKGIRVISRLNRMIQHSILIRQILASERKLSASTGQEQKKYELELLAFRQQVRLLDNHLPHY